MRSTLASLSWPADADAAAHVDRRTATTAQQRWQSDLAAAGLVAVNWPTEHGGRGLGWLESFIVQEELALARAPELVNRTGLNLVGPTLIEHGSDEQRSRYLRRIVTAADIWCQLFSEPEAGSDLAAMRTFATETPDGWSISGQKVWTSNADVARYGILLARTGRAQGRRPPVGYFLIDMHQPGIEVRPLRQLTGDAEFSEVFFDDARVSQRDVVGRPDDGWRVMTTTLGYERTTSPRQLIVHLRLLEDLVAIARNCRLTPTQRQSLATAHTELFLYRLHLYRALTDLERGTHPGATGSLVKLYWSEMSQRMHDLWMTVQGADGLTALPGTEQYLYYRAATIFAGTSEIQRNAMAEQLLGLPRESRPEQRS